MQRILYISIIFFSLSLTVFAGENRPDARIKAIADLEQSRNYREAAEAGVHLLQDKSCPPALLRETLEILGRCLERLNRYSEIDGHIHAVLNSRQAAWDLYWQLANAYAGLRHFGYIQGETFRRGYQRGSSGRWTDVTEHDRRQVLRWFELSRNMLAGSKVKISDAVLNDFYRDYGRALLRGSRGTESWRRQLLTDLTQVPGWEAPSPEGQTDGVPADAQGTPLFSRLPASFAKASDDGERAFWLQEQRLKLGRTAVMQVLRERADDSRSLYGVQTLLHRRPYRNRSDESGNAARLQELKKLRDNETLCRLAGGVRKILLPAGQAYIPLYQRLAREFRDPEACLELIRVYLDRSRPDKALEWCRYGQELLKDRQKEGDSLAERFAGYRLQLEGSFCRLQPCRDVLTAHRKNSISMQYRNADRISLSLEQADSEALLDHVFQDLRNDTGSRWFHDGLALSSWFQEKSPYRKHLRPCGQAWTLRTREKIPFQTQMEDVPLPPLPSGIYVLTARIENGSVSRIPLIVSAQRLITKNLLDGRILWQVLNAASGRPVPGQKLNLRLYDFTYRTQGRGRRRVLQTAELTAVTDGFGGVFLDPAAQPEIRGLHRYFCSGRDARNNFMLMASRGSFPENDEPLQEDHLRHLLITDRPLYRPGQQVRLKLWLQNASWRSDAVNPYAEKPLTVRIQAPDHRNFQIAAPGRTDGFGGWDGTFTLPDDIRLGQCRVFAKIRKKEIHCGSFLVEEYRKPEFEVTVSAPENLPLLGEKIPLTIRGRYYFGEPVRKGSVQVKILRYDYSSSWRPLGDWDWLYGSGSSLPGGDYGWCPLWRRQDGCLPGLPPFRPAGPPEVVLEQTAGLDNAGELRLVLDTAAARKLYGDRDHRYAVSILVRDASRRSIAAEKELIISREKFRIAAWLPRGFYHAGEKITALARTADAAGKPVRTRGLLRIYRVRYDARTGSVREEQVQKHRVKSDDEGQLEETVKLRHAGQYRFQWECSDGEAEVTGTAMVNVYGDAGEEKSFKYNDLELMADKTEYRPGESVRLRISTDEADSFVLLFIRTRDGLYPRPVYLQLLGKSMEYPIPVTGEDYPNFFVEAGMVRNGRWHWASREIQVPPARRQLGLEILPDQQELRPGAASRLKIRLTDAAGRPFQGTAVVTVYDKSLEALSGGSNVPEIFPRFWNWKYRYRHSTGRIQWDVWAIRFQNDPENMTPLGPWDGMEFFQEEGAAGMIRNSGARMLGAPRAMMKMDSMMAGDAEAESTTERDGGASGLPPVLIRSNFADTACWQAAVLTGPDGTAVIPLKMPDSLTTWKIRVWAMGRKAEAGQGETEIITAKNLMIRLSAPRFFTEEDDAVLRATVHNRGDRALKLQTELKLPDDCIVLQDGEKPLRKKKIPAGGELSFDWRVRAVRPGNARIQATVRTDHDSDGLELRVPVQERGFVRKLAFTGMLNPETGRQQHSFELPEKYRRDSAVLELSWSPLPAMAAAGAVPALIEPACESSDHILYSFLPAVLLDQALRTCSLSLEQIAAADADLNPGARAGGRRPDRFAWKDPADYSAASLQKLSSDRLKQLADMQCPDGGWSWFSGYGARSQAYITAQVVQGLLRAAEIDLISRDWVPLRRGLDWLKRYQQKEYSRLISRDRTLRKSSPDDLDALVHQVLSESGAGHAGMAEKLFAARRDLSLHGIASLALAEAVRGRQPGRHLPDLMRNLEQFLQKDPENQTVWLETRGDSGSGWWHWYNDRTDLQAVYLQLLLRTGRGNSSTARGLVKYLLGHRRNGSFWRSGRDTARILAAFAEYLEKTGRDLQDHTVQIELDGRILTTVSYSAAALLKSRHRLIIPAADLKPGRHMVTIRKSGKSPLYFNGWMDYFSREDQIAPSGMDLKISRNFYRIRRRTENMPAPDSRGGIQQQATENDLRELLKPGDPIRSGELLEAELILESKNHFEYLKLEDFRAAGLDPLDQRSGYTGNSLGAYVEFRDNRVVMYLSDLPQGRNSVRYRLRAETPGAFTALPARIQGVYAPELYGNSVSFPIRTAPTED